LAKPTQPYGSSALFTTLSRIVISISMNIEEFKALEDKYDLTTREGMMAMNKELAHDQNLKEIEHHQHIFEREYDISKENWENTTYSVKVAMIQLLRESNEKYEIEDAVREWLNQCPV